MPIYEYACQKCGTFEMTQRITDEPLSKCPTCKGKVKKLISKKLGSLQGDKLTRIPKGFSAEDPAADLLKLKQLYYWVTFDPQVATTSKLQKEIVSRFRLAHPFVRFVNEVLQPGWKKKARAAEFLE